MVQRELPGLAGLPARLTWPFQLPSCIHPGSSLALIPGVHRPGRLPLQVVSQTLLSGEPRLSPIPTYLWRPLTTPQMAQGPLR